MKSPKLRVPQKHSPAQNPLTKHSLLGSAAKLLEHAAEQKPLFGKVCLSGQFTIWFGRYGRGKSLLFYHLLIEAILDGRIEPGNVFIINADDDSVGLAQKAQLTDDHGVNVLVPGYMGFRANMLLDMMIDMTATGAARGVVIVLDTLKKFVDVMDKKASRSFNIVIREFVLAGGTLLALAHTNKQLGPDRKPIPEGVGDINSDIDCSFILDRVDDGKGNEIVIEFAADKIRGPVSLREYYAFDPDPELSYVQRLASVRKIDPEDEKYAGKLQVEDREADVIGAIEQCIKRGRVTKMDIIRTASMDAHVSRRTVLAFLEPLTGDDPATCRWNYTVGERGRHLFALLDPGTDDA